MPELTRIATREQLDALPVGSVIRSEDDDADTIVMEKVDSGVGIYWFETGYRQPVTDSTLDAWLPFQLLYQPGLP